MTIRGHEDLTPVELHDVLEAGGRFVFYEYCISLLIITLRRPSPVVLVYPEDSRFQTGLPYTLLSLFFGWWGLPWGLLYTPLVVFTNLLGGRDVTDQVRPRLLPVPA